MASGWKVTQKFDGLASAILGDAHKLQQGLHRIGFNTVGHIKQRQPVRTGFLRNSTTGEPTGWRFLIYIGADYWEYLNYGTRYIAPQYFLEAGMNQGIAELEAFIESFGYRRKS